MRLAATRSSTSLGSGGPADAGAACAAAVRGRPIAAIAAKAPPAARNRRRAIEPMSEAPSLPAVDPVLGQVDGLGEPHVPLAEHVLDEPLEHARPRRAAHHLGMEHQVEEAALLVLPLELLDPDLPDVLLAPDPVAGRLNGAEP